jgi:integrase
VAWLYQDPRSKNYKVCFRFRGRSYKKSLKTTKAGDAQIILGGVKRTLLRLEQNLLDLPLDADILTFVLSDGKQAEKASQPQIVTLQELIDQYIAACSVGAMEENSLDTTKLHLRHFVATFGKEFPVASLKMTDLQRHVERRAKKRGIRKRLLSPTTIRKEVASFRAAWNWVVQAGLLTGPFPHRGLKYPKTTEKPPFQTWEEIERQIAAGGLDAMRQRELWDCLYLTPPQIDELLAFVRAQSTHGFLYPMFALAAHTGARRSEMLRAEVTDIDFAGETILIREKKRARGERTSRRVPLSGFLVQSLRRWLDCHPGGRTLFCQTPEVVRSRKQRATPTPLTRNEAHDHFHRVLRDSKWSVLRGWHVLRHSFASNCAAAGVDERFVNAWLGHMTASMAQRYRHLRPDSQRQALALVFGTRPSGPLLEGEVLLGRD